MKVVKTMLREIILLMLIGHFLGSFYLQPYQYQQVIKDKKFLIPLVRRSVIYFLSLYVAFILMFESNASIVLLFFGFAVLHFIADFIRMRHQTYTKKDTVTIITTELVELALIPTVFLFLQQGQQLPTYAPCVKTFLTVFPFDIKAVLSWGLSVCIITRPVSDIVKRLLYKYRPKSETAFQSNGRQAAEKGVQDGSEKHTTVTTGHPNAGSFIGMLERCIILLLLTVGQYAGLGLCSQLNQLLVMIVFLKIRSLLNIIYLVRF